MHWNNLTDLIRFIRLGESISMLQNQMTHYTLEEMKELFANYSKLTAKQKYLIMQSIRYLIANPDYVDIEDTHE